MIVPNNQVSMEAFSEKTYLIDWCLTATVAVFQLYCGVLLKRKNGFILIINYTIRT